MAAFKLISRGDGDLKARYRPQTLGELVPTCSSRQIKAILKGDNPSRVYLLEGASGTGKTTCARIIARAAVCQSDGPKPCLTCVTCRKLETSVDFVEINIANFRKIDDIRENVDTMRYHPMELSKKIYIFDEVHQLTNASQQLLLKVLEEPPEHLLIFLCTTEKKGLNKALVDRATSVKFKSVAKKQSLEVISQLIELEGIDIPERVREDLHKRSEGSVRALLNGVQLFADGGVELLDAEEQEASGDIRSLAKALMDKKWGDAIDVLKDDSVKRSPESTRIGVTSYLRAVCLNKSNIASVIKAGSALSHLVGAPTEDTPVCQYNELVMRCLKACKTSK